MFSHRVKVICTAILCLHSCLSIQYVNFVHMYTHSVRTNTRPVSIGYFLASKYKYLELLPESSLADF